VTAIGVDEQPYQRGSVELTVKIVADESDKTGRIRRQQPASAPARRARLLMVERSGHGRRMAAIGVTGPCGLAVARGRFSVAPIAALGAVSASVIGSTRTFLEAGGTTALAGDLRDVAGAVDCAGASPAT
jgi:hypothetical protein